MASIAEYTEEELSKEIKLFRKKVKGLASAGPGAGMACAMAAVRLRDLETAQALRQSALAR